MNFDGLTTFLSNVQVIVGRGSAVTWHSNRRRSPSTTVTSFSFCVNTGAFPVTLSFLSIILPSTQLTSICLSVLRRAGFRASTPTLFSMPVCFFLLPRTDLKSVLAFWGGSDLLRVEAPGLPGQPPFFAKTARKSTCCGALTFRSSSLDFAVRRLALKSIGPVGSSWRRPSAPCRLPSTARKSCCSASWWRGWSSRCSLVLACLLRGPLMLAASSGSPSSFAVPLLLAVPSATPTVWWASLQEEKKKETGWTKKSPWKLCLQT